MRGRKGVKCRACWPNDRPVTTIFKRAHIIHNRTGNLFTRVRSARSTKWMISPIDYHYLVDFSTFASLSTKEWECSMFVRCNVMQLRIRNGMGDACAATNGTDIRGSSAIILIYCNCVYSIWNVLDLIKCVPMTELMLAESIILSNAPSSHFAFFRFHSIVRFWFHRLLHSTHFGIVYKLALL